MKRIYETIMTVIGSNSRGFSGRRRRLILCSVFFLGFLFAGTQQAKADLGLSREAYGVWDREGGHSVSTYPYTRGQEYAAEWTAVNPARSNFNWTAMDNLLQLAYDQNQRFFVKIQPVSATTVPPWIFSAGVPQIVCPGLTYGYPLDPEYKLYLSEMVIALGKHLRQDVPAHLRDIVSLVRVDTGATGDEGPYDPADEPSVPAQYALAKEDPAWQAFRIWLFGVYDQAFQHGTGPAIPLIFQDIETPAYATEQGWVRTNVTSGFGAKYGGQVRGYHLSESKNVPDSFKALSMDTPFKFFSANEMDQTWEKFYFQLNLKLTMYWCAVEQLNAGLTIWDWSGSALEGAAANGMVSAAEFFNTWAAELDPPTARGGFCIFHEGLDSSDTNKFPEANYGSPAKMSTTARYTAICAAYASQGAKMDHLTAATWGQVAQRRDQNGFNDSGWEIWPGNYERFITQINPTNESVGLWRVRGTLTTSSHPYDRFARRFDRASNRNAMRFNVNDRLTPAPGQSIQLSVIYLDSGTNRFGLLYDAVGNSQKSAFTVTKANSNTWKTNSVTVTDWVFGNNGPNGSDLVLTNMDSSGDTTFSRIELVKLVNVTLNVVGQGTVSARNDATVYSPVTGTYATGQRLEMTVTPGSGYEFSGWSGDLSGSNSRAIFFPTNVNTQVTATFANTGLLISQDNFSSTNFTGGTGWSGGWSTSGGALVELDADLNSLVAHLSANGQITRVAATPIGSGGQLTFRWKIKSLETGESAQAEVYNGSWHVVWFKESTLTELGTTNIDLSAYSNISQVRFTVNAGGGADNFYVDDVSLSGVVAKYTLTVNSGSGSGSYTNGAQVAILAYPVSGKTFYRWTGSTQVVNNVTYTNALVTMSTNAVTLTATYVDVYYALTVNSGSGSGSYTNGTVVSVTASNAPSGKVFDQWVGSGAQYLANASSASTTVTMPVQAVSLTATYADAYYALTVTGGTGGGSYTNSRQVAISANAPTIGKAFSQWIGDTQFVASASSASTTVTMPAQAIALTATYVDVYYALTVTGGTGGGSYTNSRQVAISANAPTIGKAFSQWAGDTQYVNNTTNMNALVTMSTNAVSLTATYVDVYYALTVNSGVGDGSYTNSRQVAIAADVIAGKTFAAWIGDTQVVASVSSSNTTVTMPAQAIALTATYVDTTYALTVNSGTGGGGTYTNGTRVAIAANAPADGKAFDKWIGDTQYVDNASSLNTTVTMPAQAVSLTATYADVNYSLTINYGTGGGLSYTNEQKVAILANTPAAGKAFDKWTGDTQYLDNASSASTWMTMPARDVVLTATYVDVYYALTVNSGIGDGSYTNGTQVDISADAPAGGQAFDHWTGDTQYAANSNSASTTVTMPAQAISLTATYKVAYVTLTGQGSTGGSVSPASTNVIPGYPVTFVITASNYYRIFAVYTNGGNIGVAFNNNSTSYTLILSNQIGAVTVTATFVQQVVTNPAASGANVPYSWMAGYGLTNSGATFDQAAVVDHDGDGLTAWQEYIAGTDPTNTTSGFKAAQATRNVITWSPVSGRVYSVYWSTNLVKGFTMKQDNILYPTNSYTNATPDPRVNHYQIKVRME